MKKKALIVSTVSRQFYLFEQVNIEILKDLGYEVHGAANFSDWNPRLEQVDIIRHPIDIQRNPFSLKNIIAYRQLKKLMKEQNFDLVHCHSPVGGVLARLAARAAYADLSIDRSIDRSVEDRVVADSSDVDFAVTDSATTDKFETDEDAIDKSTKAKSDIKKYVLKRLAAKKYVSDNSAADKIDEKAVGDLNRANRVIYTTHGFHFFKGSSLLSWLLFYPIERWMAGYTDRLITINKEDYKRARAFKRCRVEYVPGIGIDSAAYGSLDIDRRALRRKLGIADDETVIICVAELNKNKNQQVLIKSLAAMKTDKIRLMLCGTGAREGRLRQLVEKYGLKDRVMFMGYRNDIAQMLAAADIFTLPSYREGLPVSVMEAMASGLPVVCSRVRGNTDLIKDGRGGFLLPVSDAAAFADAFDKLAADSKLRASFGAYNRRRIRQFDKKNVKEKMKEIYISMDRQTGSAGPRRIAFVIGSMGCGGAERVISILANSYADSGWQVDIIRLLNRECAYRLRENIRFIDICNENSLRLLYLPVWLYKLRQYIKKHKPDKIVSFIARINVITLVAGLGLGSEIIISERNNPKKDGRNLIVKLATFIVYPLAKRIVFQTRAELACFPAYIRKKAVIVPNPVDVQAYAAEKRSRKIVSAGRLTWAKNHKMLINAFARIKAEHPEYCLYIYGEGALREKLEEQIKELGLEECVFLPGNVDNLHERMADAEIFVLSSYYEGQSNALIEAMMMGLPCISSRYEGVTELIKNGKNGLLVRPDDDEHLYHKLNILIKDKQLALNIGKQAQDSVRHMKSENCLPVWRSAIED